MYPFTVISVSAVILVQSYAQFIVYENDINFRIEAGSKTCFFEKGNAGQTLELYYQVLDGQHGDLDISFKVVDPNGVPLITDHKKSQNSVIMELVTDGDYAFCMDNTYSVMNSKLVFASVLIEDKVKVGAAAAEAEVAVVSDDGEEVVEEEILEWAGVDEDGQEYYIEVRDIADCLSRTLQHVVKARQQLDVYGASKSRDSYMAFEDTFIVDVWSAFQISFMCIVGMLQVYMIKKLFNNPFNKCVY